MTLTTRRALILAVVLGVPPAAQAASEDLSASVALRFQAASRGLGAPSFRPRGAAGISQALQLAGAVDSWDKYLRDHTRVVVEEDVSAAAPTLAADLDLQVLLNKQLKTDLRFNMGGKTVWCGGVFDRRQNGYLSVLVDGQAARYYDVKWISKHEEKLRLGAKSYKLRLVANIFNKLKSAIVFTNLDDENDATHFNLKEMLVAVADAGASVALSGQPYRVFYTDGLRDNRPDASARLFTFLTTEPNGDLRVYLIPEELVPADRVASFKLFADRLVGLTRLRDSLKIYDNP